MSEASFRFNPYAQDDGRIDLGVDLREGTIPAGAGAAIAPNPQPEHEHEGEHEGQADALHPDPNPGLDPVTSADTSGTEPCEPPTSGDAVADPQPQTKVLTGAGKQTPPRTGPKPRTK